MNGQAYIVVGLGFGDEGKGTITDYLTRTQGATHVVRFCGGPQAGHNIVTPDGRWHCFAQFGSGMFVPSTISCLGSDMLIEPEALLVEADVLASKDVEDVIERMIIDPDCRVVTPMHKMVGQMLELWRGTAQHGSCGMGVGQTVFTSERGLSLTVGDLCVDGRGVEKTLQHLRTWASEEGRWLLASREGVDSHAALHECFEYFRKRTEIGLLLGAYAKFARLAGHRVAPVREHVMQALEASDAVVFEGAQGALLDRRFGFAPYVTKTRPTAQGAIDMLHSQEDCSATKIGVLRAYGHRHGAGPFVTEDASLTTRLADEYNSENAWQGPFRLGWMDVVSLRYGIQLNDGVDGLALTGLDRLSGLEEIRVCTAYEYRGPLEALDHFASWERTSEGKIRILGLVTPSQDDRYQGEFARVIAQCHPSEWKTFPGWNQSIRHARSVGDLPRGARMLVSWLSSESGLGVPVHIVSVGPSAEHKFFL